MWNPPRKVARKPTKLRLEKSKHKLSTNELKDRDLAEKYGIYNRPADLDFGQTWLGTFRPLKGVCPTQGDSASSRCYQLNCSTQTSHVRQTNATIYLLPIRGDANHHNMWGFLFNFYGPLMNRVDSAEQCGAAEGCLYPGIAAQNRALVVAEPRQYSPPVAAGPDDGIPGKWRRALEILFPAGVYLRFDEPMRGTLSQNVPDLSKSHANALELPKAGMFVRRLIPGCAGVNGETVGRRYHFAVLRRAGLEAYLPSPQHHRFSRQLNNTDDSYPRISFTAVGTLQALVESYSVEKVVHVARDDRKSPCRTLEDGALIRGAFSALSKSHSENLKTKSGNHSFNWAECCAWHSPGVASNAVSLAAHADVFLGMHGAGLAHCLWMREGATFVEISACHNFDRW